MIPSVKSAVAGLLAAAAIASATDVTQLTQSTFNDYVKENDIVLAECMPSNHLPLCRRLSNNH